MLDTDDVETRRNYTVRYAQPKGSAVATVFFSYSHADEALRDQLEKQLSMLKRQGVIETWHDRRIGPGNEFDRVISDRIQSDDIILLLVSPDFIASKYCYDREMTKAMERHEAGEAIVLPVILRPCDWEDAPFGNLLVTPTDGKPVTKWPDRDEAFLQVARAVRDAAGRINAVSNASEKNAASQATSQSTSSSSHRANAVSEPRSSNLRLAKNFTEKDKDQFLVDTFEYMARFFENSLTELEKRNQGTEGRFRRVDANRFTATLYVNGKIAARCTVFLGGGFNSRNICFVQGESSESNSYNDALRVEADDHALYFLSFAVIGLGSARDVKLSQEGASEHFWSMLIAPFQRG